MAANAALPECLTDRAVAVFTRPGLQPVVGQGTGHHVDGVVAPVRHSHRLRGPVPEPPDWAGPGGQPQGAGRTFQGQAKRR